MAIKKLVQKVLIKGKITCETGLRIGGNKSSLEIGGLDLNIIKAANGQPYIPGSSIKGKLRSLLGKIRGSEKADNDETDIRLLFGASGANDKNFTEEKIGKSVSTRLFVRDAELNVPLFKDKFGDSSQLDFTYSEVKTENVINRSTGKAEHPRSIERVPAGAVFHLDIMLDVYEDDNLEGNLKLLGEALQLLHYDYLGGHGSRGSGKVTVQLTEVKGIAFVEGKLSDTVDPVLEEFKTIVNAQHAPL